MNGNNTYDEELDDDGLPKYAPDGKNIAAYQMYKLGMTDKLPDPEDTHTPFFRTPSYYREKEMKAEANPMTLSLQNSQPIREMEFPKLAQANTGTRYDAGMPPLVNSASRPGNAETSASFWENFFNTMGQFSLQFNNAATADDIRHYSNQNRQESRVNDGTSSPVTKNPVPSAKPAAFAAAPSDGPIQTRQAKPVNPDNPYCLPRETAFEPDKGDPKNLYPFTRELTHDINRALTEKLGCKSYGIDFARISGWEGGNKNQSYVPWKEGSTGNNSGVTVGSGVDFGQKNLQTLKRMGLSDELIAKLQNHIGLRQGAAKSYNNKNPLTFTWEEIDQINRGASLMHAEEAIRHWDKRVQQSRPLYPNAPLFHEMTSPQQTLVFSRYYHQGSGWIQKHPELFNSILENNWDRVSEHWGRLIKENSKNGNKWKTDRLYNEYKYFWPDKEP